MLRLSPKAFALLRTPVDGGKPVFAVTNISDQNCELRIPLTELGIDFKKWRDRVREVTVVMEDGSLFLTLKPYDIAWLIPET